MSEVAKMETNNSSFLEGRRNHAPESYVVAEQTIKERMGIHVTDRMLELLKIEDVLMDLMISLPDDGLVRQIDNLISSVKSEIWEEVRDKFYIQCR